MHVARWLANLVFRLFFWWKKRTGWLDLGEVATITGTVIGSDLSESDDDQNFHVRLDPGQDRWITGFGGRLTTDAPDLGPLLLCEIPPWAEPGLRRQFARLRIGDRVRVTGAWGFDGVHVASSRWKDVLLAIVRHQPNIREGWFELHPVTDLEILRNE